MTTKTIYTWLDSGANHQSCYYDSFEVDEAEWNAMTEAEQEDYAKQVALERMDWGFSEDKPKGMRG